MIGYAYVGRIVEIEPVENADRIEQATVVCGHGGMWKGVVKKGEYAKGDECEVYLQDAKLPDVERFAFMGPRFVVNVKKIRGAFSECLIMPRTVDYPVGSDITEWAGVVKYERPEDWHIAGEEAGSFPSFVPKTDEPNFQKAKSILDAMAFNPWYVSLKYDGSSGTAYVDGDGIVRGCSRNRELREKEGTLVWELIKKYGLKEKLPELCILLNKRLAIQFEMVGPKVQKNPLGLLVPEARLFNLYSITDGEYLGLSQLEQAAFFLGIPMVDVLDEGDAFDMTADEIRWYADKSVYPGGKHAEGVVFRTKFPARSRLGERVSFKSLSHNYN